MPPGGGWITKEKVAVSQSEKEAEGRLGLYGKIISAPLQKNKQTKVVHGSVPSGSEVLIA